MNKHLKAITLAIMLIVSTDVALAGTEATQAQPVTPQTQIDIHTGDQASAQSRLEQRNRDDNRRMHDGDNLTINHDYDHDRYRDHGYRQGTRYEDNDRDGGRDFWRYHYHDRYRQGNWFIGLRMTPQPSYHANCAEVPVNERIYAGERVNSYVECTDREGHEYACAKVICN